MGLVFRRLPRPLAEAKNETDMYYRLYRIVNVTSLFHCFGFFRVKKNLGQQAVLENGNWGQRLNAMGFQGWNSELHLMVKWCPSYRMNGFKKRRIFLVKNTAQNVWKLVDNLTYVGKMSERTWKAPGKITPNHKKRISLVLLEAERLISMTFVALSRLAELPPFPPLKQRDVIFSNINILQWSF